MTKEKEEFEKWFMQAKEDLSSAKYNFDGEKYYVAVFLCQQAVEKGLKALWLSRGNKLIKIHNLMVLGKNVDLPEKFLLAVRDLSGGYVNSRDDMMIGGIPSTRYSRKDSDIFIKLSEEVLEWIKLKI